MKTGKRVILPLLTVLALSPALMSCAVRVAPAPVPVVSEQVIIRDAPPPPREEVIVEAPSPRHIWVPGHWVWHGEWIWEPGHWRMRPHPHAAWIAGYWERRGGGWVWVNGYWR